MGPKPWTNQCFTGCVPWLATGIPCFLCQPRISMTYTKIWHTGFGYVWVEIQDPQEPHLRSFKYLQFSQFSGTSTIRFWILNELLNDLICHSMSFCWLLGGSFQDPNIVTLATNQSSNFLKWQVSICNHLHRFQPLTGTQVWDPQDPLMKVYSGQSWIPCKEI